MPNEDNGVVGQIDIAGDLSENAIIVEVVYASEDRQLLRQIEVNIGTTVIAAVLSSGMLAEFSELNVNDLTLGIFGRLVPGETQLQANDRVEIYRPLTIDPKQARRRRAKKG